jgi:hypothetical protein
MDAVMKRTAAGATSSPVPPLAARDLHSTSFVSASPEEIELAEQLRRRLEQRYLNRPASATRYWSLGAD